MEFLFLVAVPTVSVLTAGWAIHRSTVRRSVAPVVIAGLLWAFLTALAADALRTADGYDVIVPGFILLFVSLPGAVGMVGGWILGLVRRRREAARPVPPPLPSAQRLS